MISLSCQNHLRIHQPACRSTSALAQPTEMEMFKCSFYVRETFESKRNKIKKKYIIKLLNNFIRFAKRDWVRARSPAQWHSGFAATSNRSESHIKKRQTIVMRVIVKCAQNANRRWMECACCVDAAFSPHRNQLPLLRWYFSLFYTNLLRMYLKVMGSLWLPDIYDAPVSVVAFDRYVFSHRQWRAFAPVRNSWVLLSMHLAFAKYDREFSISIAPTDVDYAINCVIRFYASVKRTRRVPAQTMNANGIDYLLFSFI